MAGSKLELFPWEAEGNSASLVAGRNTCAPKIALPAQRWKPRVSRYIRTLTLCAIALECSSAFAQSGSLGQIALPSAGFAGIAAGKAPKDPRLSPTDTQSIALHQRAPEPIVIGFVGGFVKRDDRKHEEMRFANQIRAQYKGVHADVYNNHQGALALQQILSLLDTNHDGVLTAAEKNKALIVLYGHSWGASETIDLARELGRKGIPVLLTIQIDTIAKPGQQRSLIPSNVVRAVNFYQTHGLLHGSTTIRAADPARTTIIGNYRMTYNPHSICCREYRWFARVFTKPHVEIESDPRVWNEIGSLIDAELLKAGESGKQSGTHSESTASGLSPGH